MAVDTSEPERTYWHWPQEKRWAFEDQYGSDYSIVGFEDQIGVQRKADDLVASLFGEKRKGDDLEQLESQVRRLAPLRFPCVIVECGVGYLLSHGYVSDTHPHSVIARLVRICCEYRVPCWLAGSREAGQYLCGEWLEKSWRIISAGVQSHVPQGCMPNREVF